MKFHFFNDDDQEAKNLWLKTTQNVTPLPHQRPLSLFQSLSDKKNGFCNKIEKNETHSKKSIPPITAKQKTDALPQIHAQNHAIDPKHLKKIAKGKIKLDAILDLHGMDQQSAYLKLKQFIYENHALQKRNLLVITGKGKKYGREKGILQENLPNWLAGPPLNLFVRANSIAARPHGEQGARYVFLKKSHK